ncbi:broad substrate specificity ATP-binding cassette transporter ABCG2d [Genypterus blacodes]|uniref:broad substrate specificity ATP-binding cassette transporter ABCG2d n=1 Tax=Genypterus blacodes TaxID=154954 RepID=UPI003F76A17B
MEDIRINGVDGSKVITSTDQTKQPCGSIVSFHNIHYKVLQNTGFFCKTTSRDILVNLNGIMKPGLNAILGPTGSGKSSFLDVLAARKDPAGLSGEVLIDGAPQPSNFKCLSGYVVQDDVLMGTLTVRENLCFSAALRLPSSVPQKEKERRVNHIIRELGLTKVADSKVGTPLIHGISGGEKKRTSIGMEVITDPSVLFLDEPTTGLDAATAISVLQLLKRMASRGKTVILSIHQPRYSIYRLFDTLTLLVGGKMLYHGPQHNTLDYFANIGYPCEPHNNPADFFVDVLNGDSVAISMTKVNGSEDFEKLISTQQSTEERLVEDYQNSSYSRDTLNELEEIAKDKSCVSRLTSHNITYNSSYFHQLHWVFKRTFQKHFLTPQLTMAELAANAVLGILIGTVFFDVKNAQSAIQNRMGAFFFLSTHLCFTSLSASEAFIFEKKLFLHEHISGYYRVSVYFLAKILANLAMHTITSIIFCCIIYFMIGFKFTVDAFFVFLLTATLESYTASAMTTAISADKSVMGFTVLILNITFVVMMIFSGYLVNLSSLLYWLAWVKYFSIPRYGLAAMQINEFVGLKFCEKSGIPNSTASHGFTIINGDTVGPICTGEQHLELMDIDYTTWGLWQNHVALMSMAFIFYSIGYLKLRFMKKFT